MWTEGLFSTTVVLSFHCFYEHVVSSIVEIGLDPPEEILEQLVRHDHTILQEDDSPWGRMCDAWYNSAWYVYSI